MYVKCCLCVLQSRASKFNINVKIEKIRPINGLFGGGGGFRYKNKIVKTNHRILFFTSVPLFSLFLSMLFSYTAWFLKRLKVVSASCLLFNSLILAEDLSDRKFHYHFH